MLIDHVYMITGYDGAFISGNGTISFARLPSTPTDLSVTNITSSSATLTFTASPPTDNVLGYAVYLNGSLFKTNMDISPVITLSDLVTGTDYSVYIIAFNHLGNSGISATVQFVTN